MWKPNYKRVPKIHKVYGYPIKVYDNEGRSFDQYTVIYMHKCNYDKRTGEWDALDMSKNPYFGVGSHCGIANPGVYLGKRILYRDLPKECKQVVRDDIREYKKWIRKHGGKI